MSKSKVAISIDDELLSKLDALVAQQIYPSRSQAFERAIRDQIEKNEKSRLSRECEKLDIGFEQQLADEGMKEDFAEWPEY